MKDKLKNMKVATKLYAGFGIVTVLLVLSLYFAYTTAAQIITVEDQEHYLSSYGYFTAVEFIVMMLVTGGICVVIPRLIQKNLKKVIEAAEQIAAGKTDITIEKTANDEFGELIDAFNKVIEGTKIQAEAAQQDVQQHGGNHYFVHCLIPPISSGNRRRHRWQSQTRHWPCRPRVHRRGSAAGC